MKRVQDRLRRAFRSKGPSALLAFGVAGIIALTGCGGLSLKAGSGPQSNPAARIPAAHTSAGLPAGQIPAVSGHLLRALWQRALRADLVVDGGLVLSTSFLAEPARVYAVSASTGSEVWTADTPGRLLAIGLVPGNGIVVLEAGHQYGPMFAPGVTEYVALDLRTGRRLWTTGAPYHFESPAIAISGNRVLTADLSGAITARQAATGRVLWRRRPPSGCWRRGPGPLASAIALAADQTQVAASFSCDGYRALVQMLDPSTGAMSWSWGAPRTALGAHTGLTVTGVASQGEVVLLTGQDAPPAGPYPFARTLPRLYSWPTSLGPPDDIQVVLALDARTGRPRWIELGGQSVGFTLADGAVCETVSTGMECRDDVTGAPTSPVLETGQSDVPSYAGDGSAGISGSIAAVTVAPFGAGHVTVEVIPIRGERPLGRTEVGTGISPANASHATEQPFVVDAGTLPGGHTVLLLRRVDLPNYPIVALEVTQALG
jgi:outer membrane protein assembly factor BamB